MSGAVPAASRLRREPRQARSRARLAQILAAADAILAEEGVEALTIRRIAERAGVPVGTLYQFFPDKGSVVDAVARAYIAEFDALGKSEIRECGYPGIWRVTHWNAAGELIGRYLEVTFVPTLLASQPRDVRAGLERLSASLQNSALPAAVARA